MAPTSPAWQALRCSSGSQGEKPDVSSGRAPCDFLRGGGARTARVSAPVRQAASPVPKGWGPPPVQCARCVDRRCRSGGLGPRRSHLRRREPRPAQHPAAAVRGRCVNGWTIGAPGRPPRPAHRGVHRGRARPGLGPEAWAQGGRTPTGLRRSDAVQACGRAAAGSGLPPDASDAAGRPWRRLHQVVRPRSIRWPLETPQAPGGHGEGRAQ